MSPPDPVPPGWQPNWPTDDPSFQPHTAGSPGVQGPTTPPTWSNGQDPGWAPGTKPGQGGRPYGRGWSPGDSPPSPKAYDMDKKQWLYGDDPIQPATRPEGPYEANTVENERKWRESQFSPVRQPGWENRYLDFARKQEGWNPEWDDYLPQLLRYLQKPDVDPRESYHTSPVTDPGGATTAPVKMGIPRELWGQITEFGKTIPGINSREWQRSEFGGRTPQLTPYQQVPGGVEMSPPDPVPPEIRRNMQPYRQEELQPYGQAGGQSPSVLSDLARKNAIRRQVLARLMGRPTGASSLMELMGQQQPY